MIYNESYDKIFSLNQFDNIIKNYYFKKVIQESDNANM